MAIVDDSNKFLQLSDVRVSYRKNGDSVQITSSDPAFPQGFHLPLSKGTHTEKILRDLLRSHNLIPAVEQNPVNALSIMGRLEKGSPSEQAQLLAEQLASLLTKKTIQERARFENFLFTLFSHIKTADRSKISTIDFNAGVYNILQSLFEHKNNFFELVEAVPDCRTDYLEQLKTSGSHDMKFYRTCQKAFKPEEETTK